MYESLRARLGKIAPRVISTVSLHIVNSASNLNADVCNHLLRDNPSCNMCGNNYESCSHLFIECPKHCVFKDIY